MFFSNNLRPVLCALCFSTAGASGEALSVLDENSAPSGMELRDTAGYKSENWYYLNGGTVTLTELSIPIRENPGPGEYRFLSFAWRLWHAGQIALQLDRAPSLNAEPQPGEQYDYRLDAGEGPPLGGKALRVTDKITGNWQTVTSDLWKDFGDFTITGITFQAEGSDAGFD
jgi:hypothetical protein